MDAAPTVRFADAPPATADVVVIGGGVIGCATAFFAARAGLDVVVLERRAALATLTTPVSTGAFRLQFDNPEEIELVREGVDLFESFAARTGLDGWDLGLRHGGYLFCSLTDATVERSRRLVERQRDWGLTDVELLTGDQARERWPWLSPEVRGARYRARDGWLDPKRLSVGYATAASNADRIPDGTPGGGATFVTHAGANEIVLEGDRVRGVRTTRGEISAGAVVVSTGPFLANTVALAGIGVELRPTRRQKLVLPWLPQVPGGRTDDDRGGDGGPLATVPRRSASPSSPMRTPRPASRTTRCRSSTTGPSACSTRGRLTPSLAWRPSGATSGPMARRRRTGSCRPASTR